MRRVRYSMLLACLTLPAGISAPAAYREQNLNYHRRAALGAYKRRVGGLGGPRNASKLVAAAKKFAGCDRRAAGPPRRTGPSYSDPACHARGTNLFAFRGEKG